MHVLLSQLDEASCRNLGVLPQHQPTCRSTCDSTWLSHPRRTYRGIKGLVLHTRRVLALHPSSGTVHTAHTARHMPHVTCRTSRTTRALLLFEPQLHIIDITTDSRSTSSARSIRHAVASHSRSRLAENSFGLHMTHTGTCIGILSFDFIGIHRCSWRTRLHRCSLREKASLIHWLVDHQASSSHVMHL